MDLLSFCVFFLAISGIAASNSSSFPFPLRSANRLYINGQNTTEGSAFHQNARHLLSFLVSSTSPSQAFVYSAYGSGDTNADTAFGASACFSFNTTGDCSQCLQSIQPFFTRYPLALGVQLWISRPPSGCVLRYENYPLTPEPEVSPPMVVPPQPSRVPPLNSPVVPLSIPLSRPESSAAENLLNSVLLIIIQLIVY